MIVIAAFVPLTITLLLSNRHIQQWVVSQANQQLCDYTGHPLHIGGMKYELFTTLCFNDLYIPDAQNDTLAVLHEVRAHILPSSLFADKWEVDIFDIKELDFRLATDSTHSTNLQYLIDAFTPKEPIELKFRILIENLSIHHSRFSFDRKDQPKLSGRMDFNHLQFEDINTEIHIEEATPDSLYADIRHFSVKEKGGLCIKHLQTRFEVDSIHIKLCDFLLEMPQSQFKIDSLALRFTDWNQIADRNRWNQGITAQVAIDSANINGNDFACLVPNLSKLNYPIRCKLRASASHEILHLQTLRCSYGPSTLINLNGLINSPLQKEETFIYADVTEISTNTEAVSTILQTFQVDTRNMPPELYRLGNLCYKGNLSGFFSDIVAYGNLYTTLGTIHTDLELNYRTDNGDLKFSGDIGTTRLQLYRLLGKEGKLQSLTANLNAVGVWPHNSKLHGKVAGTIKELIWNNYAFNNINLVANYDLDKADFNLSYADGNGNGTLNAEGKWLYGSKQMRLEATAAVDSLNPEALHLVNGIKDLKFDTRMRTELNFSNLNDIQGYVNVDSLQLIYKGNPYSIPNNRLELEGLADNRTITLHSPLAEISLNGALQPLSAATNLQHLLAKQLTALPFIQNEAKAAANNFQVRAQIAPLTPLNTLFETSWFLDDTCYVYGSFNDNTQLIELNAQLNDLEFNKHRMDTLTLELNNRNDNWLLMAQTTLESNLDTTDFDLTVSLFQNRVNVDLGWLNHVDKDFSGVVSSDILFREPEDPNHKWNILCTLHPSQMMLSDSLWTLDKGTISYNEESLLINNINCESNNQFLRIDGAAHRADSSQIISASLKNVDLAYISEVFYMPDFKLSGWVSGNVTIGQALHHPTINADVTSRNFGFNSYTVGNVCAKANYNYQQQQIDIQGKVINNSGDTTSVEGYVSPIKKNLYLAMDLHRIDLKFIKPYLVSFSDDLEGTASGRFYVGGPFEGVEIWGEPYVENAMVSIAFLQTRFHFTDTVYIKRDRIEFRNIKLYDDLGNPCSFNGLITHHLFTDFKYDIGFGVNNALILNTTEKDLPDFYGTIYATGSAYINGDANYVDIQVAAKPEKGSYFTIPLDNYQNAADNQFITYISHEDKQRNREERRKQRRMRIMPSTKLNVDIGIEATPDVEARIVMDSHTGDIIRGRGNGNLKVNIDNNANIKIFGKYALTEGDYQFSLQGSMRKKFDVGENSSISFDGNPLNGILDINAMYQTNASLIDLLEESMLSDIKNTNVKVNCIANISGTLMEPAVKFDLKMPNADDEILRRVKATINTDEMMSQQMVFLLLMGKFYNPQSVNRTFNNSMAASFAAATLSSQLNYWVSQMSQNVNLGLNYQDNGSDQTNVQAFEVNISTNLLNNRLYINSNLGYRTQYGSSDFIGDFDVEYKLTNSGRWRLKAYNKTNDKLYSTSLYTQGLGFMYKENFDNIKTLSEQYRQSLRKKTEEEKAEEAKQKEKEKADRKIERQNRKLLREDRWRRHLIYKEQQKAARQQKKANKQSKNN